MSEKLKIELSAIEIEAIVKSLKLAGVVEGNAKTLLQSFHDQGLVQAARKSHKYLRHLLDSQAVRKMANESDVLREKENDTVAASLKKSLREARNEIDKLNQLYHPAQNNITNAIRDIKLEKYDAAITKLESTIEGIKKACPY